MVFKISGVVILPPILYVAFSPTEATLFGGKKQKSFTVDANRGTLDGEAGRFNT